MQKTDGPILFEFGGYFVEKPTRELHGRPEKSLCVLCKGSRFLCGKERCPLMLRFYAHAKTRKLIESLDLFGSSPPGVFIGRYGYPKVEIGPLVPPVLGDTSVLDTPELWIGRSIDDIVSFRFSLVRGKYRISVHDVDSPSKIVEQTRELALSVNSIGVEAKFERLPSGRIILDDEIQPFGPSADLKALNIENPKYDHRIEKAFYDTDLKAVDAVVSLYRNGVMISRIQKAFSVGAFGLKANRKFVPTRWSITAIDDIIGRALLQKTKTYHPIDEFRLYYWEQLDNRWIVLLLPTSWRYELIEAWYPNTAWNPSGKSIEIISDHEFYSGRSNYAQIGGCYYAARLAVNELLNKEKRQAGAVIFREAHPGYIMPVGVWNVRENVRAALNQKPLKFNSLKDALLQVQTKMDIPIHVWIDYSEILKDLIHQRRIDEYE
ncbi:MAG: Nre family DNA repair protein [Methanomassiliicoccales archaeon]